MRVGLLLPNNIYYCPYCQIYINILKKRHIDYDIFYWNKNKINEKARFQFDFTISGKTTKLKKLFGYYLYMQFLKRNLRKHAYSKIIVFGSQIGIFLLSFLKKKYNHLMIFDYRDLSIEQYLTRNFIKLLSISSLNIISSAGFKSCLPTGYNYILSHNFNVDIVNNNIFNTKLNDIETGDQIIVLTIGAIRNYKQNIEIINALANDEKYKLLFVGKGPDSQRIDDYVLINKIRNVTIVSFYNKEEEKNYINQATFLNIYYPRILSHNISMSNRFYNALIYGKPMITTENTIQGNYAKKYNLGISISNTISLKEDIHFYLKNYNLAKYKKNREELLSEFLNDYSIFEDKLISTLLDEN